jgi:hypothetical protein
MVKTMEVRLLLPWEPVFFRRFHSGLPPDSEAAAAPNAAQRANVIALLDTPKPPKTPITPKIPEAEGETAFDRETITERAAKLPSVFYRELKYEVLEEAGVVQIQVIDARDGRVVRKVPADEVVKFVEAMKKKIDDRLDVRA